MDEQTDRQTDKHISKKKKVIRCTYYREISVVYYTCICICMCMYFGYATIIFPRMYKLYAYMSVDIHVKYWF